MTNPNDPNNPFGGQDNNPFGGGYGNNSSNSNNQNPADSTGSTSYGQGGYGQSGSSSYGQGGSSAYGQTGADQTGSTPNSGYGDSTFGQSGQNGYGYDQGGSGYGAYGQTPGQDGYGQNSYDQAYAPGPGFQHPENDPNASESGRPLQPAGGPLPVVEPIPFAFKRLFTKNWHVYIGFTVLMTVGLVLSFLIFLAPMMAQMANDPTVLDDPNYNPIVENPVSFILFYLVFFILALLLAIVLYKVALRDSRGEEPSWGTLFKNIPWGQAILVNILVGLVAGVFASVLILISALLAAIHPALIFIGVVVMLVGIFAAIPFIGMVPLYVYDGRANAGGAFKMAWGDVKANFWPILGSMILVSLVCGAISFFTFGLGVFVVQPLQILAYVFIYRWISAHRDQSNQAGTQHPEPPSGYMSMY